MNPKQQDEAMSRVRKSERRYNAAKLFLTILSLVLTLGYIYARSVLSQRENKMTRSLIVCIVEVDPRADWTSHVKICKEKYL